LLLRSKHTVAPAYTDAAVLDAEEAAAESENTGAVK
jgi:hypothetical protein